MSAALVHDDPTFAYGWL